MRTLKVKLSKLVFDPHLYPRHTVSEANVAKLVRAIRAGVDLPPIVVGGETLKIVDGVHRWKALCKVFGDDHVIKVEVRTYADPGELFADAIRLNHRQGKALSEEDVTYCLTKADEFCLSAEVLAEVLSMRREELGELRSERCGELRVAARPPQPVYVPPAVRHLKGRNLTPRQVENIPKLRPDLGVSLCVRQLLIALRGDLIDMSKDANVNGLREIAELIREKLNGPPQTGMN